MRRQQRHRRRRLSSAAATAAAAALGNDTLSSYFASATSASMTASSPPSPLLAFLGRRRRRAGSSCPPDSDSEDEGAGGTSLSLPALLARRPDALLAAAVPRAAVLFGAGAAAGALGKTLTAPLDRVKLLLQTSGGFETGAIRAATAGGGPLAAASLSSVGRGGARSVSRVVDALAAIGRQEGVAGLWRGNLPQILKVVPYSATQLCAYELFKRALAPEEAAEEEKREGASSSSSSSSPSSRLSVGRRLAAGAAAGMVATLATHPLDTLRLRMAVDPAARSLPAAVKLLASEGGVRAFYRGLGASVAGIAPTWPSSCRLSTCSPGAAPGAPAALPPCPPLPGACWRPGSRRRSVTLSTRLDGGCSWGSHPPLRLLLLFLLLLLLPLPLPLASPPPSARANSSPPPWRSRGRRASPPSTAALCRAA